MDNTQHSEITAESVFESYSPFIREFIYSRGWQSLHEVQVIAAHVIFNTEDNLLIPSSTASGKTEAAFFPILSQFYDDVPASVGAIYIAPLKSLINDQFNRIADLLDMTGIPVYHWHGDVALSHKGKMIKDPAGVLQITPESLESMLMNRSNDIVRLFGDLRYVIIDEIHTLTGNDRGNQIMCQLVRIAHIIGHVPRRIGLSATIGDMEAAARWLGGGSPRATFIPQFPPQKIKWKLGMEHFYIQNEQLDQSRDAGDKEPRGNIPLSERVPEERDSTDVDEVFTEETNLAAALEGEQITAKLAKEEKEEAVLAVLDPGYEYMYDCTQGKKALVFSNSREETEYVTATLRQIADARSEPDIFLIHHGNLSASIREEAEMKMRNTEVPAVTCATVTMELGIDIGRLDRVIQSGAPNSVASFLQRLGRSGRREAPAEMMMVFREEKALSNAPLPQLIPWDLLKGIAIVQLYIEERFIEPPRIKKMPFSLAFQQTLSVLASCGSLKAKELAERVMALPPFEPIHREDYRELMLSMLQNDYLQMTDEREMLIGLKGERLINSFKFYAVFKDDENFSVRCDSDEIGTITTPPPLGDRFGLAGRVWEVLDLDVPRRLVYVKRVPGKMEVLWPGVGGEIHTKILERMKQVLAEDTVYPYLKQNARHRLDVARHLARSTGMLDHSMLSLGGYSWILFPWLGTRSFRTLRRYMARHSASHKISSIEYESCYYTTFKMEVGDDRSYIAELHNKIMNEGIDKDSLIGANETPVFEKYDEFIPSTLLRAAYREDKLQTNEIIKRIPEIYREYEER